MHIDVHSRQCTLYVHICKLVTTACVHVVQTYPVCLQARKGRSAQNGACIAMELLVERQWWLGRLCGRQHRMVVTSAGAIALLRFPFFLQNEKPAVLITRALPYQSFTWLGQCARVPGRGLSRSQTPPVMRKGSGDYWVMSWLYRVNSLDFGQADEIVLHHPSICVGQWNRPYIIQACNQSWFKINTADSAQPRNHSIVTRSFPLWETGSGHKTRMWVLIPPESTCSLTCFALCTGGMPSHADDVMWWHHGSQWSEWMV